MPRAPHSLRTPSVPKIPSPAHFAQQFTTVSHVAATVSPTLTITTSFQGLLQKTALWASQTCHWNRNGVSRTANAINGRDE